MYDGSPFWRDWEADFFCPKCEKDTVHTFLARGAIQYAICADCSNEEEVDPDGF